MKLRAYAFLLPLCALGLTSCKVSRLKPVTSLEASKTIAGSQPSSDCDPDAIRYVAVIENLQLMDLVCSLTSVDGDIFLSDGQTSATSTVGTRSTSFRNTRPPSINLSGLVLENVASPKIPTVVVPEYKDLDPKAANPMSGQGIVLPPGYYPEGIDIGGTNSTVTLSAGNYFVSGIRIRGSFNKLQSEPDKEVTLFIVPPSENHPTNIRGISIEGLRNTFNIKAPTEGPYNGIAIYDADSENAVILSYRDGYHRTELQGALVAPEADVTFSGGDHLITLFTLFAKNVNAFTYQGGMIQGSSHRIILKGGPFTACSALR